MDSLYDSTSEYFQTIPNQLETINSIGNYGIVSLYNSKREQTILTPFNGEDVEIYGNPTNYEIEFTSLFDNINIDIDDGNNPIIVDFLDKYPNSYEGAIDTIKTNLKNYIKKVQGGFSTKFATTIQTILSYEQDFYQLIRKISLVYTQVDGKLLSGNVPRVYNLSGTTGPADTDIDTLVELKEDFKKFTEVMSDYNLILQDYYIINNKDLEYFSGDYETPFETELLNDYDKYFYMVMSRDLTNQNTLTQFQTEMAKGLESNNQLIRRLNRSIEDVTNRYKKQLKKEEKIFTDFKKTKDYKEFTEGLDENLYVKGKTRKMNYDTNTNSNTQSNGELIKQLYLEPFRFK
jgi:hypothetical protein